MYCNHDAEAIVWNIKYTIINKYKGILNNLCLIKLEKDIHALDILLHIFLYIFLDL